MDEHFKQIQGIPGFPDCMYFMLMIACISRDAVSYD